MKKTKHNHFSQLCKQIINGLTVKCHHSADMFAIYPDLCEKRILYNWTIRKFTWIPTVEMLMLVMYSFTHSSLGWNRWLSICCPITNSFSTCVAANLKGDQYHLSNPLNKQAETIKHCIHSLIQMLQFDTADYVHTVQTRFNNLA